MRAAVATVVASVALVGSTGAQGQATVSPEPFFANADYGGLALSPSGRYIGALVPVGGRVQLGIIDLDAKTSRVVAAVDDGHVTWFRWINAKRLVFGGAVLDTELQFRRGTGMYAVEADGTDFRRIGYTFHSVLRDGSDDVLVLSNQRNRRSPDVYRVNTRTGERTLKTPDHPGDVIRWVADHMGTVRAAVVAEKSVAWRIYWRPAEGARWEELLHYHLGEPRIWPVDFDGDGGLIVASNIGRDTFALYRYDTQKRALGEEIAAHPQVDLTGGLRFDASGNRVVGVTYDGAWPGAVWFDADQARLQKSIDAALPGHTNSLQAEGSRVLVFSYSDADPGLYYLFDRSSSRLEFVAAVRKAIRPETMPERKPVRYEARDGMEVPGYLTLPKGKSPRNLPLVVHVHGGPFVRGAHWAWSAVPAYLAALGYAVLEPEFRGTVGWGTRLHRAGWKQWGRAMQDDLDDGVDWLAKQGTIDPKRACIMGASYGGYAVLIGLARDPSRWRCGIDYFGVTDINLYFDVTWSDYAYSDWIDYAAKEMIGDPDKDAALLKAASPLENAAKIKAPVLMAYGLQDRRVPIIHGRKMRDLLEEHGIPFEWVVYQKEGHGFQLEKNRLDFIRRVAAFLAKYNPAD